MDHVDAVVQAVLGWGALFALGLVAGGFIVLFLLATIRTGLRDRARHGWHPSMGPRDRDQWASLGRSNPKARTAR